MSVGMYDYLYSKRLVQLNGMGLLLHRTMSSLFLLSSKQVSGFLLLLVSLLALDINLGSVLIQLHQLGKIELGFLKKLDLSYNNVLEGEDLSGILDNLFADRISSSIIELMISKIILVSL
jgi:hypothetical protein